MKAHAARAQDARHGAGQLSRGAQRAPTREACDDGWLRVEAIVAAAEASAGEATRMAHLDTSALPQQKHTAIQSKAAPTSLNTNEADERLKKQAAARYYYLSARDITGTLGERYLRETRGIEGDLSEFKFHPRVRDTHQIDGEAQISYHPAIVVAARNEANDIVATQTILLNPVTAEKVDKNSVGAVNCATNDRSGGIERVYKSKVTNTIGVSIEG